MPPVTATTKRVMKMSDIYQGLVDEMITVGSDPLDPDNIITACITPMCPFGNDFRIATNGGNTFVTPVNYPEGAWQFKTGGAGDIYGYFEDSTSASITDMHAMTGVFPPELKWFTDLETTAVITDMDGNIAYTQPWSGLTWPYYSIGWDFSPGSASMIVQMHHGAAHQSVGHAFASDVMEGSVAVVPLPSIPITSNSWSAYVSSGTREYEIRSAEMEAENAMWKGLANTGTSAMNGAVAGAITGSGAGAAAGAAVGAIFNVAGTLIGAELDAQTRPKVQALKDTAV